VASLEPETASRLSYIWIVPVFAVIASGLIWYTGAQVARHFLAVLALLFVCIVHFDRDVGVVLWMALIAGLGLFLLDALYPDVLDRATGWSISLGAYGFLAVQMVLLIFQFNDHIFAQTRDVMTGVVILAVA
ncbi:hypothetical protein LJD47_27035, partial [Escherichia coli]|nr:hypothetical protein [Escherichia coli]